MRSLLRFKAYLRAAQDKHGYLLHCYVLMSNHYHLLIETLEANLGKLMHCINGSYTNYINRRKRRSAHLFQRRYKAILVDRGPRAVVRIRTCFCGKEVWQSTPNVI